MKRDRPQTSTMWIVTINSNDFQFFNNLRFTSFSGVKDKTETIVYESPFLHRKYTIPTSRAYEPVTLRMPYISKQHSQVINTWNSYVNTPLQIRIEPVIGCNTTEEERSLGYAIDLSGCLWISCDVANVERSDNKISELEVQFTFVSAKEIEI